MGTIEAGLARKCCEQFYSNALPDASFYAMQEEGQTNNPEFKKYYYLSRKRRNEIINNLLPPSGLSKKAQKDFKREIKTWAPTTNKRTSKLNQLSYLIMLDIIEDMPEVKDQLHSIGDLPKIREIELDYTVPDKYIKGKINNFLKKQNIKLSSGERYSILHKISTEFIGDKKEE